MMKSNTFEVFCSQGREGFKFCVNDCKRPSIMCENKDCKCYKNHSSCLIFAEIKSVLDSLQIKSEEWKSHHSYIFEHYAEILKIIDICMRDAEVVVESSDKCVSKEALQLQTCLRDKDFEKINGKLIQGVLRMMIKNTQETQKNYRNQRIIQYFDEMRLSLQRTSARLLKALEMQIRPGKEQEKKTVEKQSEQEVVKFVKEDSKDVYTSNEIFEFLQESNILKSRNIPNMIKFSTVIPNLNSEPIGDQVQMSNLKQDTLQKNQTEIDQQDQVEEDLQGTCFSIPVAGYIKTVQQQGSLTELKTSKNDVQKSDKDQSKNNSLLINSIIVEEKQSLEESVELKTEPDKKDNIESSESTQCRTQFCSKERTVSLSIASTVTKKQAPRKGSETLYSTDCQESEDMGYSLSKHESMEKVEETNSHQQFQKIEERVIQKKQVNGKKLQKKNKGKKTRPSQRKRRRLSEAKILNQEISKENNLKEIKESSNADEDIEEEDK